MFAKHFLNKIISPPRHQDTKRGAYRESGGTLSKGLSQFQQDAQLNICMGVSLMNLGEYEQALSHFLGFQDVKEAVHFAAERYKALRIKNGNCLI
jgi:hypothetical protein